MNTYNPYKEYPKIFNQTKSTCRVFFLIHKNIFLSYSFNEEDLFQESCISVLETINKFKSKPEEDLHKLCRNVVFWKLCLLLRDVKRKVNHETTVKTETSESSSELKNEYVSLVFEALKSKLEEQVYFVIYETIVNSKTMAEIGKELGVTKQYVSLLYRKGLRKAKFIINKSDI